MTGGFSVPAIPTFPHVAIIIRIRRMLSKLPLVSSFHVSQSVSI